MFSFSKKRNTQFGKRSSERIFLDYASTTPVDQKVFEKMKPFFSHNFFNPAALYNEAISIKKIINDYRIKLAKLLQVKDNEIYFTSGGTESNNIALLGIFNFYKNKINNPHFIISKIEHPSIIETIKFIEKKGGEVSMIGVNIEGIIDLEQLKNSLQENTVLVSIIYANNEIGVVQPVSKISRIIKKYKKEKSISENSAPFLHTDASQAPVYLDCNCDHLKVDMMTLDGSKIYGPKGSGCLIKKSYVEIENINFGGGQEKGLRSGTENVPMIVGFSEAFMNAQNDFKKESRKVSEMRNYFAEELKKELPDISINGSTEHRIANNLNICLEGVDAEFTVIKLDQEGLACAYTTACKTLGDESKSYVVEALNNGNCEASSLRFSLGRETDKSELKKAVKIIKKVLNSVKK